MCQRHALNFQTRSLGPTCRTSEQILPTAVRKWIAPIHSSVLSLVSRALLQISDSLFGESRGQKLTSRVNGLRASPTRISGAGLDISSLLCLHYRLLKQSQWVSVSQGSEQHCILLSMVQFVRSIRSVIFAIYFSCLENVFVQLYTCRCKDPGSRPAYNGVG